MDRSSIRAMAQPNILAKTPETEQKRRLQKFQERARERAEFLGAQRRAVNAINQLMDEVGTERQTKKIEKRVGLPKGVIPIPQKVVVDKARTKEEATTSRRIVNNGQQTKQMYGSRVTHPRIIPRIRPTVRMTGIGRELTKSQEFASGYNTVRSLLIPLGTVNPTATDGRTDAYVELSLEQTVPPKAKGRLFNKLPSDRDQKDPKAIKGTFGDPSAPHATNVGFRILMAEPLDDREEIPSSELIEVGATEACLFPPNRIAQIESVDPSDYSRYFGTFETVDPAVESSMRNIAGIALPPDPGNPSSDARANLDQVIEMIDFIDRVYPGGGPAPTGVHIKQSV